MPPEVADTEGELDPADHHRRAQIDPDRERARLTDVDRRAEPARLARIVEVVVEEGA